MTDRLIVAIAILAAVAAVGAVVRYSAGQWTARRTRTVTLPKTELGSTRLLVFSTRFCGDCATQHQVIEESRSTWPRPVDVSYHDAVTDRESARQFGILTVPAIVVARSDGRIVGVRQGLVGADRLRSLIEAAA